MVKIFHIIALILICGSSKGQSIKVNDNETPIQKFPQIIKVSFTNVGNYLYSEPLEIHIKDSLLIFQNSQTPENGYWFNILNKKGKVVDKKIKKGKGPDEILNPGSCGLNNDNFWVFDRGIRKYWVVNDFLKDNFKANKTSIDLVIGRCRFFNDSTVITRGGTGTNYKYDLYDFKNKKIIGGFGDLKTLSKLNLNNKVRFANGWEPQVEKGYFDGDFKLKPDKTKLVVGYYYFDVLEIYTANGELVKAVRGPLRLSPDFKMFANENYAGLDKPPHTIIAYTYIQCSDKYIYAAFSGKQLNEGSPFHPKKIYVFNWNGDSIAILNLDHPIMSFGIDENEKTIYAVSGSTGAFIKAHFSIE